MPIPWFHIPQPSRFDGGEIWPRHEQENESALSEDIVTKMIVFLLQNSWTEVQISAIDIFCICSTDFSGFQPLDRFKSAGKRRNTNKVTPGKHIPVSIIPGIYVSTALRNLGSRAFYIPAVINNQIPNTPTFSYIYKLQMSCGVLMVVAEMTTESPLRAIRVWEPYVITWYLVPVLLYVFLQGEASCVSAFPSEPVAWGQRPCSRLAARKTVQYMHVVHRSSFTTRMASAAVPLAFVISVFSRLLHEPNMYECWTSYRFFRYIET